MSRRRPAAVSPLTPLALGGRLAQLAADRFPAARAPMSQSDRAAYWLGEYVKARHDLPHIKPSDLLALIAEQDPAATGATFTRTIKRLAQSHPDVRTKVIPSPNSASRRKVLAHIPSVTSAPPPVKTVTAVSSSLPPSHRIDDDSATDPDLLARMQGLRASPPRRDEA